MDQSVIDDKYAPTGWKRKKSTFDVQLPSGQLVQVRKLGMKEIVKTGLVSQLDTFTAQLIPNGTNNPEADAGRVILEALKDEKKFEQLEATIDKIISVCVIQPKVMKVPPEGYERNPEAVYIDEIDLDDKMAIFAAVFEGAGDMSDFREGQNRDMAAVEAQPESESSTQPDGGIPAGIS